MVTSRQAEPIATGEKKAPVISLRNVTFTYRDGVRPALRDVTLEVGHGEMIVVMGATGAGKSTLAKCLNRTIPAFQPGRLEGEVAIAGRILVDEGVVAVADLIGLVSQDFEAQLFATNVSQEVAFGLEQRGVERGQMQERVAAALRVVGLDGFEDRDPATLSGGEKQRLAIAAVLALEPQVLVFDEPTTDLDPEGKLQVFDVLAALRRQGRTIVLIEHEIAAAERADRVVLMAAGQIVADAPRDDLLAEVDRLESVGVRSADLDRLAHAIGHRGHVSTLTAAHALVQARAHVERFSPPSERTDGAEVLSVEDVTFRYEPGRDVLSHVSLRVHEGEFIALIGQNGSGKTTLARHLNGLLVPSSGTVRLRGRQIRDVPLNEVATDVGYVFQNPDHQIFSASVRDEMTFGLRNFGVRGRELEDRVERALAEVGLSGLDAEDPFLLGKGQRQRLAVASLLALQPRILVLDEPTTGLDYPEQRRMMELLEQLHQHGMTLIVITHSPWVVAEYAQRGVLLRSGRVIFDGPLRALFAEETLLSECHFRVPEITRLGRRFGFTPLTVSEFLTVVDGLPQHSQHGASTPDRGTV